MARRSSRNSPASLSFLAVFAIWSLLLNPAHGTLTSAISNLCRGAWCFNSEDVPDTSVELRISGPLPASAQAQAQVQAKGASYVPDYSDDGGIKCLNPNAPKRSEDWNIAKSNTFPTVEEMMADYRLCGIASSDTVHALFSSFGASMQDRNKFKQSDEGKTLNLKTVTEIMPAHWIQAGLKFSTDVSLSKSPAQRLWTFRASQAFAAVAVGDIYVVTNHKKPANYDEKAFGPFTPANIYTTPYVNQDDPYMGKHNVWYSMEFHTAQQNPLITAIYTVSNVNLDDPSAQHADKTGAGAWVRNPRKGSDAPFFLNANDISLAGLQQLKDDFSKLPTAEQGKIKEEKCAWEGLGRFASHAKRAVAAAAAGAAAGGSCVAEPPHTTFHTHVTSASSKHGSHSSSKAPLESPTHAPAKESPKVKKPAHPQAKHAPAARAAPSPAA